MPEEVKHPDLGTLKSLPERQPLGQHVYSHLKQAILRGEIAPGSRLVESRLAGILGISRTPVREGIHKLEREQIVRRGPSGGFFVVGLSREEIRETFGIRAALESYAASLAALHHREEDLAPLDRKIAEYQEHMERGHLEALPRINTAFHDHLYTLSRSPKLIKMINELRDQIYRFRRMLLKSMEGARISNEDHILMLECIRNRDAEKAERVVREHILRGQDVVLVDFDQQESGNR